MPVNFPNSPSNDDEHSANGLVYKYNSTKGAWKRKFVAPTDATDINQLTDSSGLLTSSSTNVVADMAALIALTGMSSGDQAYVTANNKLYFYNGSGWYLIATVQNDAPSAITGVNGTYELAVDGTVTTITAVSTDPEGFPLTWSYSTSGLGSIATVSNTDGVFTITPSTTIADAGTFTLTINATDGINGAVSTSTNLTLEFIVTVTNSKYTTLLATATGTSDNNNITDASTNNHTVTVNGDATAGTFSPYRSGGYSWDFQGAGFYTNDTGHGESIEAENTASAFNVGTNDYTIEGWFKERDSETYSTNPNARLFDLGPNDNISLMRNYPNTGGKKLLLKENSSVIITSTNDVFDGNWHFIQVVRTGGYTKLYVDGTEEGSIASTTNINAISKIIVGAWSDYSYGFDGQIADFRFSNTARTAAVPTERLTSDSNTKLLVCSKPYLVDESGTATSLILRKSANGTRDYPDAIAFSPYDYDEYDATDHGGSVYFDQGSNLTLADNDNWDLTSSNFTIKFWVYMQQDTFPSGYIKWIDNAQTTTSTQGNWTLGVQSNQQVRLLIWDSSGTLTINTYSGTSKLIHNHQWYYVEWSGGTIKVNGETYISYTHPNTGAIGGNMVIGSGQNHEGNKEAYMKGYMADLHFVNGSTAAESSIPTAPMSSVSDTKLHIKGTDASIIDKSQSANLKLEGSVAGSTTQVKFASTKSMSFDSVDDLINLNGVLDLSQACTWEAWVYFDNHPDASGFMHMFQSASYTSTDPPFGIRFKTTGSMKINFVLYTTSGNHEVQSPNAVSLDTWYHLAFSRTSSGVYNVYIDGTRYSTFTESATYQSAGDVMVIGNSGTGSVPSRFLDGYMQDIRITQGLARYTAADETSNIPSAPLEG